MNKAERLMQFTRQPVRHIDVPWPEKLKTIGQIESVIYRSNNYDGKVKRYEHKFENEPIIAHGDKDGLLVILGDVWVDKDGIHG